MKIRIDEDQLQDLKMILDLVSEKVNLLTIEISRRTDHIKERDLRQEKIMDRIIKLMEGIGSRYELQANEEKKRLNSIFDPLKPPGDLNIRNTFSMNFKKKGEQNETEEHEVQEFQEKSKRSSYSEDEKAGSESRKNSKIIKENNREKI